MRTTLAPKTSVPMIFAGSRSAGMKIQHLKPFRAACAAVAFARLPVEEQETVSNPKARALASATASTRSLKLKAGRQTASFFTYKVLAPSSRASRGAVISGVNPTVRLFRKFSGVGRQSGERQILGGPWATCA